MALNSIDHRITESQRRSPVPLLRGLRRGPVTASSILNVLQLAFLAPAGPAMLFWGSWTCQERFPLLDTEILVHSQGVVQSIRSV